MHCGKCGNNQKHKNGIVKGRQGYKCKSCQFHYTVRKRSNVKSIQTKRLALQLYLGFRAIGQLLQISYGRVYKWVKVQGEQVSLASPQEAVEGRSSRAR